MERHERPDCYRCRSFFVTWDAARPYGCRAFGMKSRALPAVAVEHASGAPCRAFVAKPPSTAPGSTNPPGSR